MLIHPQPISEIDAAAAVESERAHAFCPAPAEHFHHSLIIAEAHADVFVLHDLWWCVEDEVARDEDRLFVAHAVGFEQSERLVERRVDLVEGQVGAAVEFALEDLRCEPDGRVLLQALAQFEDPATGVVNMDNTFRWVAACP